MRDPIPDSVLTNLCRAFEKENGYFVWEELPGWVQAVDPNVKRFRLRYLDDGSFTCIIEFRKRGYTAFLLRWA